MTRSDYARIAELVLAATGIVLSESKHALVTSRLLHQLRANNLHSFSDYIDLVLRDVSGTAQQALISAITTNVTRFFREDHHFATLQSQVLPALVQRARAGGRVRLWSAGCSSGEEAYSLAGVVLAACPEAATLDLRILATDIDHAVLRQAMAGAYPSQDTAAVPAAIRRILFEAEDQVGLCHVKPTVRRLISFKALNLMGDWPISGNFDVILCRNVVIYFDRSGQDGLWQRFVATLVPSGLLMIGHSERISGPASQNLQLCGVTTYRKADTEISAPAKAIQEATG